MQKETYGDRHDMSDDIFDIDTDSHEADSDRTAWYESYTGYMRDADTIMQFLTPAQVEVVVETAIANGYCKDDETYTEGFLKGNKLEKPSKPLSELAKVNRPDGKRSSKMVFTTDPFFDNGEVNADVRLVAKNTYGIVSDATIKKCRKIASKAYTMVKNNDGPPNSIKNTIRRDLLSAIYKKSPDVSEINSKVYRELGIKEKEIETLVTGIYKYAVTKNKQNKIK